MNVDVDNYRFTTDNYHLRNNSFLLFIEAVRNAFAKMPLLVGMNLALLKLWDKNFKMPDEKTLTKLKIALGANTFVPALIKLATRHINRLQSTTVMTISHIVSLVTVVASTKYIHDIYLKHLNNVNTYALRRVLVLQTTLALFHGLATIMIDNKFSRRYIYEISSDTINRIERIGRGLRNLVRRLGVDTSVLDTNSDTDSISNVSDVSDVSDVSSPP